MHMYDVLLPHAVLYINWQAWRKYFVLQKYFLTLRWVQSCLKTAERGMIWRNCFLHIQFWTKYFCFSKSLHHLKDVLTVPLFSLAWTFTCLGWRFFFFSLLWFTLQTLLCLVNPHIPLILPTLLMPRCRVKGNTVSSMLRWYFWQAWGQVPSKVQAP